MLSTHHVNESLVANWGWLLLWGIVLLILGISAISVAAFTTLVSVIFLGVLLLIGGVVIIIDAFKSWRVKRDGFLLNLLMGILYIVIGGFLIESPVLASVSITLFLGIFFIIVGIFRIVASVAFQFYSWGFTFLNGFITLILGLLIINSWPASSLFIIGLFIGIDLVIAGIAYIAIALAAHK